MENSPTSKEQMGLISSFLDIAVGQTIDTAVQFLQATSWKLEEAIQLFLIGSEDGGVLSSLSSQLVHQSDGGRENAAVNNGVAQDVGDGGVCAPLPVKRETLSQPSPVVAFQNLDGSKCPTVWDSNQCSALTTNGSRDNLASLYHPPFALMCNGPFNKAKLEASIEDKWLLVNLQSTEEFSSHMLNRDTWSNEAVAQTVRTNFIFWQVYHDTSEGMKVCNYYNLVSFPAILIIDPTTGQKMRSWSGMIQPERLLEDLLQFVDKCPKEHHVTLPHKRPRETVESSPPKRPVFLPSVDKIFEQVDEEGLLRKAEASMEAEGSLRSPATDDDPTIKKDAETSSNEKLSYPPLPEEPKGNRELVCRVRIRLPDGRRVQRNFLYTDPVKLLWSLCCSQLEEGETRTFHFRQTTPGSSKLIDYKCKLTFEEADLSNSMISLIWD